MTTSETCNSWAYFLLAETCGLIKIGSSADVARRVVELQGASPDTFTFLGRISEDIISESEVHDKFSDFHERNEWFSAAPPILEYIESNCDKSLVCVPRESRLEIRRRVKKEKEDRAEQKRLERIQIQEAKTREIIALQERPPLRKDAGKILGKILKNALDALRHPREKPNQEAKPE